MKHRDPTTKRIVDRTKKLRDDAIVNEALCLRVFGSSDEYAKHLPNAINRWNETAEWLEKIFGGFGLRLEQTGAGSFKFKPTSPDAWKRALGMLWTLCSERPLPNHRKMPDLDWMFDWMMLGGMPQNKINWEATAKQGAWNMRLRKTKVGTATRKAAALREQLADDKQRLEDREFKRMGKIMMRAPRRSGVFGRIPVIDSRPPRHWPDKPEELVLPVTSARTVFPPGSDDPK